MNSRKLASWITGVSMGVALLAPVGMAADWPMWGGSPARNMGASEAKNLPVDFDPGQFKGDSDHVDMATTRHIKWVAKMGSQTFGNPVVTQGVVLVGTNNEAHTDDRIKGDHSLLRCFDAATGKERWTLFVPKLGNGKVGDWEYLGICSSPCVDGDRVYLATNRCEIMCLDLHGMANGNQGEQDEGAYLANLDKVAAGEAKPLPVHPNDADIIWHYDMTKELGVFQHNITAGSVVVFGGVVYAATSNGVDWSHTKITNPKAPALIALDKRTGKLVGEEDSQISTRIFHGDWSSPAVGMIDGKPMLVFGGPDGFCYGFNPKPVDEDGDGTLKELWRYDGNLPSYRHHPDGTPIKYSRPEGPSEFIATPVVYKNRVYAAIGQDPEHGEGIGRLSCIDPTKRGNISATGAVWTYTGINRSLSTVAITGHLLFTSDFSGFVYCLDADTGKLYWKHDTMSHIWGSCFVADGKLYVGNEDGDLLILKADEGKDGKPTVLNTVHFPNPILSTPVAQDGVLYVATTTNLFAIEGPTGNK